MKPRRREAEADDAPEKVKRMPFDIATLNCYAYNVDNPAELVSVLEARLAMVLPEPVQ